MIVNIFILLQIQATSLPLVNKLRVGVIDKFKENDLDDVITYVTHSTGVIINAYAKKDAQNINGIATIHIQKDAQGFDVVSGNESLSTVCIEHADINADTDGEYIIEASYINPEILSKKVFETKEKLEMFIINHLEEVNHILKMELNHFVL